MISAENADCFGNKVQQIKNFTISPIYPIKHRIVFGSSPRQIRKAFY
ncbi:MAG: hypothetical protein ACK481_08820 [Candidatus Melainabacteria bacterium]|jgi:hypothetical protein